MHSPSTSTTPEHRLRKAVWPDIQQVTCVSYEHSPGRGSQEFLGNRTAFDVYIEYLDVAGAERFIGIEVKYHEDLSGKAPDLRDRALAVLRGSGSFLPTAEQAVTSGRTAQLLLDHLLVLSMNAHEGRLGRFVILYPASNTAVEKHVATYNSHLADGDESFQALTLEGVMAAFGTVLGDAWLQEFHARYLDLAAIELLDSASG